MELENDHVLDGNATIATRVRANGPERGVIQPTSTVGFG